MGKVKISLGRVIRAEARDVPKPPRGGEGDRACNLEGDNGEDYIEEAEVGNQG